MCSRKSVGPKIDPWWTPVLTGYSCEYFHQEPHEANNYLEKKK